jgi:DNA-binding SARP family transcriptional activator
VTGRVARQGGAGWVGRLAALVRGLLALAVLAGLLAGIPAVLFAVGADPRTVRLPSLDRVGQLLTSPDDGTLLIAVLRVVGWAGWAGFAVSVVVEAVAAVAGWTVPVVRGLAGMQRPAGYLVAAVAAALAVPAAATASAPAAHAAPAAAALPDPTPGPAVGGDTRPGIAAAGPGPSRTAGTAGAAAGGGPPAASGWAGTPEHHAGGAAETAARSGGRLPAVRVGRYDSLWRIAERHLGDGRRWPEVYRLNTGRRQPDGQTLADPDHIEEGWTLLLPADAGGAGPGEVVVVVHPGDTLSGIAERHLGTSAATDALFQANAGRLQPDGRRLTDPDRIYPGWQLLLPQPSRSEPTTPAVPPRPQTGSPPPTPETHPAPTGTPRSPAAPPPEATPPRSTTAPAAPPSPAGSTVPSPAPGTRSPAPSATPSPAGDGSRTGGPSRPARPQPPGVPLPGGWIDLGLAAALGAAATLVWARRRRGYTPQPPSPTLRLDNPGLTPLPPVVAQVRRGLRRLTGAPLANRDEADQPAGLDSEAAGTGETAPACAVPVTPGLGGPLDRLWPRAGLGLTGPGAEAAARGLLVGALAAGGADDPHARGQVVVSAGMLATLLGAAAVTVPATPRLTVTAGLPEALDVLEQQTLHRTRVVYDHEADNVPAVRQADPSEEPLPPVMLLAAAADHERARITALLVQGERLDIHGVLLGGWPDGDTVLVAADGTTTPAEDDGARHGAHPADVGRLAVLTPAQAADLLSTLAESHGGPPPTRRPAGWPPHLSTRRGDAALPPSPGSAPAAAAEAAAGAAATTQPGRPSQAAETRPGQPADGTAENDEKTTPAGPAGTVGPPASAEADTTVVTGPADPGSAATGTVETVPADHPETDLDAGIGAERGGSATAGAREPTAAAGGRTGRARVFVLGPPRVEDSAAEPGEPLRAKSLELLVYLAVQDGAAAGVETILEDLLPDAPARKAPYRLHTYVYSLRKTLARCGGPGSYLTHPAGRYALNPDTVEVDLWQLQAALADANAAADPVVRVAALRRAVDAYRGPLADGRDYEWAEPYREAVRQQALDAHLALADALTQAGQPEEALAVLTAAIGHAPYEEAVYQQAMRLHATLGQLHAVRAVRRTLTRRLEDIDTEPSHETIELADRLVRDLEGGAGRPPVTPRRHGAA